MNHISYAQCWEDSAVLRAALALSPNDSVLSIASGGDNSLALLLDNPRSVTAIDYNPAQIHLLELKVAAMQVLDYDDFIAFVGARHSSQRQYLYSLIRSRLGSEATAFWDNHPRSIERGIIHSGKFERYIQTFRRYILPLIVSRKTVNRILSSQSLDEQRTIYSTLWSNRRWRALFSLFFSRLVLGRYGRCQGAFSQVTGPTISAELFRRVEDGLSNIPARDNYFLHYILRGKYHCPTAAPDYLLPQHFHLIRERLDRLSFRVGSLAEYLRCMPPDTYSAFNLSDVFEYLSPDQVRELTASILTSSRRGSRVAFWTMFIPQPVPSIFTDQIKLSVLAPPCPTRDRGFFYGSFNLWHLTSCAGVASDDDSSVYEEAAS